MSSKVLQMAMVSILTAGCVGKVRHNEVLSELEAAQRANAELSAELNDSQHARASLRAEQMELEDDLTRQERALRMLQAREARAQQRLDDYADLVSRFQAMIDAGQLQVKVVDGRMLVELNTDILFDSGEATLSEEGARSLEAVAGILADIPNRDYQIEGHTDNEPISTATYPSNWELASARAVQVLRTLTEAGLSADRLSAASFADNRPVGDNSTPEGRAQNRRIEIVVMPDLSLMPGYDQLESFAAQ